MKKRTKKGMVKWIRKRKRMRLSQQKFYHWLSKIYRLLQSGECQLIFERMRDRAGDYVPSAYHGKGKIRINNRYPNSFFNTLIHECLHALDIDMPHREVYWLAGKIVKKMSPAQYAHLLIVLGRNLDQHYFLKQKSIDKMI